MLRRRNWDERFPKGKLYYETVQLQSMELIAKFSFIAHKPINYLDLSLREYSSLKEKRKVLVPLLFCSADPAYSKKFVGTVECCRKTLVLERRWLYTLHLDLANGREDNSVSLAVNENGNCWQPKTICFNELSVTDSVYQKSFRHFIEVALDQNGMEIDFVRRQMVLMKRVLGVRQFEVNTIEDRILNFLFPECSDSEIVKEFLSILDFNSWVLTNPKQNVLEYLLHHAYRSKYDLKMNDSEGTLVNECFFNSRFTYAELLLEYHNAPYYYNYDCAILVSSWMRDTPPDWFPEDLEIPFQKGLMSKRRYSLWLQVFHAYTVRNQPPFYGSVTSALRLMWRSLPDAYFSLEELMATYQDVPNVIDIVTKVHNFYEKTISEDLAAGHLRSLQHACRVTIRKSLCYNLELPFGIDQLLLPCKLKSFLKLEK